MKSYLPYIFFSIFFFLNSLYIESNNSNSYDGSTFLTPLNNVEIGLSILLKKNGGELNLLSSPLNYFIESNFNFNSSINFTGSQTSEIKLSLDGSLNIENNFSVLTFKFLKIFRSSNKKIENLFLLGSNTFLIFHGSKIQEFNDSFVNSFILGKNCSILFVNSEISNNKFGTLNSFIQIANYSSLEFSSCLISNISFPESTLIKIQNSKFRFLGSRIEQSSFNTQTFNAYSTSFLLTDANCSFVNSSFLNVDLNQGSLITLQDNKIDRIFVNFSKIHLLNISVDSQCLLTCFSDAPVNFFIEDVYFINNTINFERGAIIRGVDADRVFLYFNRVIFQNTIGIIIESYYIYSIIFNETFIFENNMRPVQNMKFGTYFAVQIESTIFLSFNRFYINGSYSTINVAGLLIHMYPSRPTQAQIDIQNSKLPLYVNFTNCLISRTSSINTVWSDNGSGLSFSGGLNLLASLINCFFIDNKSDKGFTCMQSYGQSTFIWFILQSVFLNNSAISQSACLGMFVISVTVNNSLFVENSLASNPEKISDFSEGTLGGTFHSECNLIKFSNSLFKSNKAYQGGVFYIYSQNVAQMNFILENNTFKENKASLGGVLSISNVLFQINTTIKGNKFSGNQAFNGGCFYLNFKSITSALLIADNIFEKNEGSKGGVSFFSIDGISLYLSSNFYNSNYAWNFSSLNILSYGGVHYLSEESSCNLVNHFNVYINNTSGSTGGVYCINRGQVKEISAQFEGNLAVTLGGSMYVRNSGDLRIFNTSFKNETVGVWGGSIYLCEHSDLYIMNSSFENCQARTGGVFYFEDFKNISILECFFRDNEAFEGGVSIIDSSENDFSLVDSEFYSAKAQKSLFLLGSSFGNNMFSSIKVSNINCPFLGLSNSKASLENSIFSSLNCPISNQGCIFSAEDSSISLNSVWVYNVTFNIDGSLFYSSYGLSIYFINIIVENLTGITENSCGNLMFSLFEIQNSFFLSTGYGCFFVGYSTASWINVTFDGSRNNGSLVQMNGQNLNDGSFITVQNSYALKIFSCAFIGNSRTISANGGAIQAEYSQINYILEIADCIFFSNSANMFGGAIYLFKQRFLIHDSIFTKNYADVGGAIYFQTEISSLTPQYIYQNLFDSNMAQTSGGAIYFNDNFTDLTNNSFQNNAAIYGSDIGSFPVQFRLRIFNISTTSFSFDFDPSNSNDILLFDSFQTNSSMDSLIIEAFPTGVSYPLAFVFDLLDSFNQTVISFNSGMGHLRSIPVTYLKKSSLLNEESLKKNGKFYDFNNDKVRIQGETDTFNRNGSFIFKNLGIYSTPSSYINLFITNDAIKISQSGITQNNITFASIDGEIGLILTIHLKECQPGELYFPDVNYCFICPLGKYSLDPADKSCSECPMYATCPGGNSISIDSGYWRTPEKDVINIYQCVNYEGACLGGVENKCAEGYYGPLCSVCQRNNVTIPFTRIGRYCIICLHDILNALFLTGLILAFLFIVLLIIRSDLKVTPENFICEAHDKKKKLSSSLLVKILVDHVQLIGVTENIGFGVPEYFRMTTDVQSNSVYFFEQMLSFDCFVQSKNLEIKFLNSVMFTRILAVALLPVVLTILIIVVWSIYNHLKRGKKQDILNKCIASIVITIFLIQPTILNTMSDVIGCIDLGKDSYVSADMSLKCWGNDHTFIIFFVSIPSLFLWIVAIPLICLHSIFRNRKNLKNKNTVMKFGFIYNGFHEKNYYFGFVKFFQKEVIILIRLSNIDSLVKMLTLLLILMANSFYNKLKNPYVHDLLNSLENASNIVTMLTLFLSLYFLAGISEDAKILIFSLIFTLNIGFLLYWLKSLYLAEKKFLVEVVSRLTHSSQIIPLRRKRTKKAKFSHPITLLSNDQVQGSRNTIEN